MNDGIYESLFKSPLPPSEPADRLVKLSPYKISSASDMLQLRDYLLHHRLPIRYEELFGLSRVYFFGEKHTSIESKKEIENLLPAFQSSGGTHISFEMLHKRAQPIIDRFNSTGDNEAEIRNQLELFGWGSSVVEGYFSILQEARRLGISIIALDVEGDSEGRYFQRHKGRNAGWSATITQIIMADKRNKILSVSGFSNLHLGYSRLRDSVNQKLEDDLRDQHLDNIRPIVTSFAHCDDDSDPHLLGAQRRGLAANIVRIARDNNLSGEKFGVIVDNGFYGGRESDIIIHLPPTS